MQNYIQEGKSLITCIDEPLQMFGNWNSDRGKVVAFKFEFCDQAIYPQCTKSREEIQKYMEDKYIVLLHNSVQFINDGFHERSFNKRLAKKWITIDTDRAT